MRWVSHYVAGPTRLKSAAVAAPRAAARMMAVHKAAAGAGAFHQEFSFILVRISGCRAAPKFRRPAGKHGRCSVSGIWEHDYSA